MNKIQIFSVSLITATLIFSGCGSSDDSSSTTPTTSTQTGTFVDAPVMGLSYKTATQSGFTDANGTFKYIDGETVEFKLGNLSLGKGTAGTLITPYTISDNNDTATNIALLLQNFDGNRSDSNVLDLSKLEDYNFSATPATVQASIETVFADNNFAQYRDAMNNSVLSDSAVKSNMDNYIANNSIEYTKRFTQAYLDTHDFYQIDTEEEGGNQRFRFRNGERQTVGDGDSSATGGFNATFDNPNDFYTEPFELKDGKIIMTFSSEGKSLKISTTITAISKTAVTTLGTVLESTMSEYPVGMTKIEIWYTDKQEALNSI